MNLERELKALCATKKGPYLRPFAPNPIWNSADVFIVGTNPATPLRDEFDNFEDYWSSLTSNTPRFENIYSTKHASGVSKTTRRARRLIAELNPVSVLVTNSIAYPTSRMSKLNNLTSHRDMGRKFFKLLLLINKPKTILFHGKEACDLCKVFFGITLDRYKAIDSQSVYSDTGIRLYGFPHFSGVGVQKGYSVAGMDEELRIFAKMAKALVSST